MLGIENIDEADYIYCRMVREKDISNVGERDETTIELETIKKKPNKIFEIVTYYYIFFDTGVVAHLSVQSGAKVEDIKEIKKSTNIDDKKTISILPIMSKDVIQTLKNKKRLSKLNFEFFMPSDCMLDINRGIGLEENSFIHLEMTIT